MNTPRNMLQDWFGAAADLTVRTARLMCGVPDYDTYLSHMRRRHPEQTPMTYADFFRTLQEARYANGRARCC